MHETILEAYEFKQKHAFSGGNDDDDGDGHKRNPLGVPLVIPLEFDLEMDDKGQKKVHQIHRANCQLVT